MSRRKFRNPKKLTQNNTYKITPIQPTTGQQAPYNTPKHPTPQNTHKHTNQQADKDYGARIARKVDAILAVRTPKKCMRACAID